MSTFVRLEQCPRCAENGRDRHGDNLGVYSDGGAHCFSCGFHRAAKFALKHLIERNVTDDKEKAVLPSDFQREIPTAGWKWLLQCQLPMSYWKTYCGYSPREERLIFTVGNPTRFSVGRFVGDPSLGKSKWKVYGDKSSYVEIVSEQLSEQIVLVEDIISAHKVGHVASSIPLFGTIITDLVVKKLQELNRPVRLWLDQDQYSLLPRKINRLQAFLGVSVSHITTRKDPKEYSIEEIKEILK